MAHKGKLIHKVLFGQIILGLVLIVCIGLTVGSMYRSAKLKEASEAAFNYSRTAAAVIDGDRVLGYLESNEKDDYYMEVLDYLNTVQKNSDILYYYIYVPTDEGLWYIWDANANGDACELGDLEEYGEGGKEKMAEVFCKDPQENILYTYQEPYGYLTCAYSPVFDSRGEPVALVGADMSTPGINHEILTFVCIITASIVAIILLSIIANVFVMNKQLLHPVSVLHDAARRMVSNLERKETLTIDVHTGDELESLSKTFEQMHGEVLEYLNQLETVTAEKERIGAELDVARNIQASMLPCIFPAFPGRQEFDIFASMTPAKEVGGDFYDFFLVDDDHLAMVMADVSGKGVPAALFMMISKTLLKSAVQSGLSPKAVLEQVNNQLCENNEAEMFVTVWLGILEISTGKLKCANAGHEYPAIMRQGGEFELFKDRHGFVLGGMEGVRYREYELELKAGDRLFVYTDGVPEATDAAETLYGTQRMIDALNRNKDESCETLLTRIHEDVDAFVGDAPQFDDLTMLCLELRTAGMKQCSIVPELDRLPEATAFFEGILEEAEAPMKVIAKVNVAVDEIFSNICRYSGATAVTLGCSAAGGELVLRFCDNGSPYNPLEKPDPDITLSAEERELGGLGIFMAKKMMDSVDYVYEDGQNILTLTKAL